MRKAAVLVPLALLAAPATAQSLGDRTTYGEVGAAIPTAHHRSVGVARVGSHLP